MNNFKSCIPCVCTGSGHKRVCEEHDIDNDSKPCLKNNKQRKLNSLTHLLATTVTYKILHRFADGVTQHRIQEMYFVNPKQLAAYITGHRYMGNTDR